MSNISKLIEELCPDGVEFKPLENFLDYAQPSKYIVSHTNYSNDFKTPVLTPGKTFILGYTDDIDGIFDASDECPIILFDDFTTSFRWIDFKFKVKSSAVKILSSKDSEVSFKYIYYAMKTIRCETLDHSRQWISNYSKIKIPVPPLVVQEEIVRILDRFTLLEAELEAELEARKKQYTFYSESAFDAIQDHIDTTIGGLATSVISGSTPRAGSKEYYLGGSIPWLRTGEIEFNEIYDAEVKVTPLAVEVYRLKIVPANSVVVAISGATAGKSAVIKTGMATNQHCCCIQVNDEIAYYKYVFYWIKKEYLNLKVKGRGARSDLNAKIIKDFPIVLPPLEEQIRIANLLDKFDSLVNDISSGLPAEIAARRKQYEHYRDQLLTFKELEPAGS